MTHNYTKTFVLLIGISLLFGALIPVSAQEFLPTEIEFNVADNHVKGFHYQIKGNENDLNKAWKNYLIEVHGLDVDFGSNQQEIHVMPAGIKSLEGFLVSRLDQSGDNKTNFYLAYVDTRHSSFERNEVGTKRLIQNLGEHFLIDYFLGYYTKELGRSRSQLSFNQVSEAIGTNNQQITYVELSQKEVDSQLSNSRLELNETLDEFDYNKDRLKMHSGTFKEFEPDYRDRWKRDRVIDRSVTKNAFTLYSNHNPDQIATLWISYVKHHLKLDVSKTAHGIYEVAKSELPGISDLPSDLNAIIKDYGRGSKISVSACPGYEICFNDKDFPREFKELKKFLKGFSNHLNRSIGTKSDEEEPEGDLEEIYSEILSLAGEIKELEYKIGDLEVDSILWANNLNGEELDSQTKNEEEIEFEELRLVVDDFLDAKRSSERTFVRWGSTEENSLETGLGEIAIVDQEKTRGNSSIIPGINLNSKVKESNPNEIEEAKNVIAGSEESLEEGEEALAQSNQQGKGLEKTLNHHKSKEAVSASNSKNEQASSESKQKDISSTSSKNNTGTEGHSDTNLEKTPAEESETTTEVQIIKKTDPEPTSTKKGNPENPIAEAKKDQIDEAEKEGTRKTTSSSTVKQVINTDEKKNDKTLIADVEIPLNKSENVRNNSVHIEESRKYYSYTIKQGDKLDDLAKRHNMKSSEILEMNALQKNEFEPGVLITLAAISKPLNSANPTASELRSSDNANNIETQEKSEGGTQTITAETSASNAESKGVEPDKSLDTSVDAGLYGRLWYYAYKIKVGEKLMDIAMRHDMTVEEVMQINGLENEILKPGSVLTLKMLRSAASSS